ncbi:MAG: alpha/beta fold hydrolase [Sutterella sp.]
MKTDRMHLQFDLVEGEMRREVDVQNGVISYAVLPAEHEDFKGVILLLHGVGSNASRWEEFTELTPLRKDWQIIRMDLRGHGASESSDRATLETHSDDAAAVLEDAGVGSALFVGHSLGAQISMTAALRHPERVSGLILLDPLVTEALTPAAQAQKKKKSLLLAAEGLARAVNRLGFRRTMSHYSLRAHDRRARSMLAEGGDALKAFIREYSSPFKDLEHIHTAAYARDLLEVGRSTPDMRSVDVPVLVIGSSAGAYTDPEKMRRWVGTLTDAQMETVECVHWPLTECPCEVSAVIESWIEKRF